MFREDMMKRSDRMRPRRRRRRKLEWGGESLEVDVRGKIERERERERESPLLKGWLSFRRFPTGQTDPRFSNRKAFVEAGNLLDISMKYRAADARVQHMIYENLSSL